MSRSVIDLNTFEELQAAAGAEFVDELVGTFFEEAPTLLAELRDAQAGGDAQRFRRAAHSLKTNAQTFGAMALGEQARALELGALPAPAGALEALEAAYAQAAAALERLRHG
jgi:HPt (histidine-containing phosphotransfer) domain-containing protein